MIAEFAIKHWNYPKDREKDWRDANKRHDKDLTLNRPFVHVSDLLENFLCPFFNILNEFIECFSCFVLCSHLETEDSFKRQVTIFFNDFRIFPVIISQKLKETILILFSCIFEPLLVFEVANTDSIDGLSSRKTSAHLRLDLGHAAHYNHSVLSFNNVGHLIDDLGPMYAFTNSAFSCNEC